MRRAVNRGAPGRPARYLHSGHLFEISNFFFFGFLGGSVTKPCWSGFCDRLLQVRLPQASMADVVPSGHVVMLPPGEYSLGRDCPPADWQTTWPSPLVVGNAPIAHWAAAADIAASKKIATARMRMIEPRAEWNASPLNCQRGPVRRSPCRAGRPGWCHILSALIVVFFRIARPRHFVMEARLSPTG